MCGIDSGAVTEGIGRRSAVGRRLGVIERIYCRRSSGGRGSTSSSTALPSADRTFLRRHSSVLRKSDRSGSRRDSEQVSSTLALLIESRIELSDWAKAETGRARQGTVGTNAGSSTSRDLRWQWCWCIMHADLLIVLLTGHCILLVAIEEQYTSKKSSYTKQNTESKASLSTTRHSFTF